MRALIIALALLPTISLAEIYKCTDAEGRVNLTDQPCGSGTDGAVLLGGTPQPKEGPTDEERKRLNAEFDRQIAEREAAKSNQYRIRRYHQGLVLGMSSEEVMRLDGWGYPDDKNVTQTIHGTREQWIYRTDPDNEYERMYLYFDDGFLDVIQD